MAFNLIQPSPAGSCNKKEETRSFFEDFRRKFQNPDPEGRTENGVSQKWSIFEAEGNETKLFQEIIYNFYKRV